MGTQVVWLLAVFAAGLGCGLYGLGLAHRLAMERIRRCLAADLHDDVGAGLTQLVLLAERMQQEIGKDESLLRDHSSRMAAVSRGLVDSLGDLVWSIDSKNDTVSELSLRMRSYAGNLLEDAGLTLHFEGPEAGERRRLKSEVRRQLYLIFKEVLRNAVRHARAGSVHVALETGFRFIRLRIADDGMGFLPEATSNHGNGLQNIRLRAREAGGTLRLASQEGRGTVVTVEVPLAFEGRFQRIRGSGRFGARALSYQGWQRFDGHSKKAGEPRDGSFSSGGDSPKRAAW